MLYLADDRPFATGMIRYLDHIAISPQVPRLVVRVRLGDHRLEAVVDTGGVYFVCHPELVEWCVEEFGPEMGIETMNIRGYNVDGTLHRVRIALEADKGQNLELGATAFVPRLAPGQTWGLPSYLGLQGCLEFLRFAVDPGENVFYFGAL